MLPHRLTYRYAPFATPVYYPLSPDEAVARLREDLFFHGHNHAFYKARCKALEARLRELETGQNN